MTPAADITTRRNLMHGARTHSAMARDYAAGALLEPRADIRAHLYGCAARAYRLAHGLYLAAGANAPADTAGDMATRCEWLADEAAREVTAPTT